MNNYLVATIKPWNINAYHRYSDTLPGNWHMVNTREELTQEFLKKLSPRYIFFPHWSWIVPETLFKSYECVCFHMTDVPYGRGGSPLQNLIVRSHKTTKLSALRMEKNLDAGPVYLKKNLSLEGRAQDIFERTAIITYEIIREIIETEPEPVAQVGEPVLFERRTEDMSRLPLNGDMELLYNHIRMLDADSYPTSFLDYGPFRLTFRNAHLQDGGPLKAEVEIFLKEEGKLSE